MATVTEPEAVPEAAEALPREYPPHRLTVERFERMVEAGIFGAKEPIFLWHGRLVEKMTKGDPHIFAVLALSKILDRLLPEGWHTRPESPVRVGDDSMPEPDLSIVRGSLRDYLGRKPSVPDTALLIEVAASSLAIDSGDVLRTYAVEGFPVYWIVNLPNRRVEVYREPTGPTDRPTYGGCRHFGPGERVPVVLDGHHVGEIAVDDFLP
jgi:Uma2 family endonuclease